MSDQKPTAEQYLAALDREIQNLVDFQKQIAVMPPVEQQKAAIKVREHQEQIKKLRIATLGAIKPGDVHSLTRAIGVPHAYTVFMELGIGSMQALVSCTRKQFQKVARPPQLGWTGGANDVPPQTDEGLVIDVSGVLASLGLRWREPASADGKRPAEKMKAALPEPVLSKEFNSSFDPTIRFSDDAFDGYGKPAYVRGIPGKMKSIVQELAVRGLYSWDDLAPHIGKDGRASGRTPGDLLRSGVNKIQVQIIQYEMRRRGLFMHKEEKPSLVYQDLFDQDNFAAREFVNKETGQVEKTEGLRPEDPVAKAEEGRVLVRADEITTVFGARIVGAVVKETDTEIHIKNEKGQVLIIPKGQVRERKKGQKILRVIDVADVVQDRIDMADSEHASDAGDGVYLEPSEREQMVSAPEDQVDPMDQGIAFPSTAGAETTIEPFAVAPEPVAAPEPFAVASDPVATAPESAVAPEPAPNQAAPVQANEAEAKK
jgi:hypothetical protein